MKKLLKTGITGMAGLGAMGAMSSMPGMPSQAKGLTGTVGTGVNLAAVGGVANIGLNIMPKQKHKKTGHHVVDKILG